MPDAARVEKYLARTLHALHKKHGLLKPRSVWRWEAPEVGFRHDNTLKPELQTEIINNIFSDDPGSHKLIGYLWDWGSGAEGITFTDTALFVTSSKNSDQFSLRYNMLASATCETDKNGTEKVLLTTISGTRYVLDSGLCNFAVACSFLQKAITVHGVWQAGPAAGSPTPAPHWEGLLGAALGLDAAAQAHAAANSAQSYAENIHAIQAHGFWAEKGNHLFDKIIGKDANIVGGDNAKYGADRIVDGIRLQSKYCKCAKDSVNACFDDKGIGNYKYKNPDGTAMKVEVPKDQYDDAVKFMAKKIEAGKVPGVTDPEQAKEIVRAGRITYNQALMLAKAGTIESLTYDAVNGIRVAGAAFGLSSVVSFAVALWNGKSLDDALSEAFSTGFKVGGIALFSSVLSAQLGRTALDGILGKGTDWLVTQFSETTVNRLASALAGKALTGKPAVNALSKLLRGNVIAATATTVVLSTSDICRIFEGGISGMQFFKNVARTGAGVVGGMAGAQGGALGGAAVGTAIFPGPGTAIGGFIGGVGGGLGGGFVVQWASNFVLDKLIEEDAAAMLKILEEAFSDLAQLYLLSTDEAEQVMHGLGQLDVPARLRAMHAAADRKNYGRQILEPLIERSIRQRRHIVPPLG